MPSASDVAWVVLAPDRLLLWTLLVASVLLWRRVGDWGRRLVYAATVGLLLVSVAPLDDWLLSPLEGRFPVPELHAGEVDGIVVLSGAENAAESLRRGQPVLGDGAERLIGFLTLARAHPGARLVLSDGGFDGGGEPIGAVTARLLFAGLGIDTTRVCFEESSTSTHENALRTADLVTRTPGDRWVLVTSAFHMPRSVGSFLEVGWRVVPYPVDFRVSGHEWFAFRPAETLQGVGRGVREWLGLAVYRVTGRTAELLPAPSAETAGAASHGEGDGTVVDPAERSAPLSSWCGSAGREDAGP